MVIQIKLTKMKRNVRNCFSTYQMKLPQGLRSNHDVFVLKHCCMSPNKLSLFVVTANQNRGVYRRTGGGPFWHMLTPNQTKYVSWLFGS